MGNAAVRCGPGPGTLCCKPQFTGLPGTLGEAQIARRRSCGPHVLRVAVSHGGGVVHTPTADLYAWHIGSTPRLARGCRSALIACRSTSPRCARLFAGLGVRVLASRLTLAPPCLQTPVDRERLGRRTLGYRVVLLPAHPNAHALRFRRQYRAETRPMAVHLGLSRPRSGCLPSTLRVADTAGQILHLFRRFTPHQQRFYVRFASFRFPSESSDAGSLRSVASIFCFAFCSLSAVLSVTVCMYWRPAYHCHV